MQSPKSRLLTLLLTAGALSCGGEQPTAPTDGPGQEPETPQVVDLDVGWITRAEPRIAFAKGYLDSSPEEGWPAEGQNVTWAAHAINWTDAPMTGVAYAWLLDGDVVDTGTVDLPASSSTEVPLELPWTFTRQELAFRIDPSNRIDEIEEGNNEVVVATDALSVALWIEDGLYKRFHDVEHSLGVGTNSFEDWAQYQVRRWNGLFKNARVPEMAPDGVLDRLRLDYVRTFPDGTLGRSEAWWTADSTVDMRYGFPTKRTTDARQFLDADLPDYAFFPSAATMLHLHEMLHMRGLSDLYRLDVYQRRPWSNILIEENGSTVAGSEFMPFIQTAFGGLGSDSLVYQYPDQGLMAHNLGRLSLHSILLLNRWAGRRTQQRQAGYPIQPYWGEMPSENRLRVTDKEGTPLAGASVGVYRSGPPPHGQPPESNYYWSNTPDLVFTAADDGTVLLGHNPFNLHPEDPGFQGPMTLIVRVEHEGRVGYGFLPVTDFNLEKWRGHDVGEYTLAVELHPVE